MIWLLNINLYITCPRLYLLLINDLQASKQKQEIFQLFIPTVLYNFRSKYLLNEAFASIRPEENFCLFEILNHILSLTV